MKQEAPGRAVLLANGLLPDPAYARSLLRDDDYVVAANGGTRVAYELERVPDLLIGDADSLPRSLQDWLLAHNVPRIMYPARKDATDLQLALEHAISLRVTRVLLLAASGGRLDHTLANVSLLALAAMAGVRAEIVVEREHLFLVYDSITLRGWAGQTVSLLPWGGDVVGVQTEGLEWELRGDTLPFGPARGISNLMRAATATVRIQSGMLLVVQQHGVLR